jgi:hypothetical protein
MKPKSENQQNKHGRYKYFEMSIHLGLTSLDSKKNCGRRQQLL